MLSLFDLLINFSCPRCGVSLRFRRVEELPGSFGSPLVGRLWVAYGASIAAADGVVSAVQGFAASLAPTVLAGLPFAG